MIRGVGTDLVEVARIDALLERYGDRFLTKVLHADEIAYCRSQARPAEHVAGRFAAKEAILKALGTGLFSGVPLPAIVVRRAPSGAPVVAMEGEAGAAAARAGVRTMHLSISHTASHALAFAVAEGMDA
jgi:holo-[acyl-carrier protein] synthase